MQKNNKNKISSLIIGFGSILDIGGVYFQNSYPFGNKQKDTKDIASDWAAIGNDLQTASKKLINENRVK